MVMAPWQETMAALPFVCGAASHDRRFPTMPSGGRCPDHPSAKVVDQSAEIKR